VDVGLETIFAVDLNSGVVAPLSDENTPASGANSLRIPWGIVMDEEDDIAFIGSQSKVVPGYAAILLVDLTTGERIVVSNSN